MKKKECITTKTLDALWSKIVKKKAGNICEHPDCCKTERLNSHHIFSRSNHAVRFDLDNGVCVCPLHHMLGNWSMHKAPMYGIEWLTKERGKAWYSRLNKKARAVGKPDKETIHAELTEIWEKLK